MQTRGFFNNTGVAGLVVDRPWSLLRVCPWWRQDNRIRVRRNCWQMVRSNGKRVERERKPLSPRLTARLIWTRGTSWIHTEWNARKTLGRRALFPGSMSAVWTSIRVDAGAQWIQRKTISSTFLSSPPRPHPLHRPSPCPIFALTAFHQQLRPAFKKNVRALKNIFIK